MAPPVKYAASFEQIAEAEGTTVGAVNVLISRALRKLRKAGLLLTARELAQELDSYRTAENIVRGTARRR